MCGLGWLRASSVLLECFADKKVVSASIWIRMADLWTSLGIELFESYDEP